MITYINFSDTKPTEAGIYIYRKNTTFTTMRTWELLEVVDRVGKLMVKDQENKNCFSGLGFYRGQFADCQLLIGKVK